MIKNVLVADRGEIAVRVIRTCRALGIRSVAVYSAADHDSLHVALADESVRIGPAAAQDSYLNIPAIVEAARGRGADSIHPGYGFLSEDADFADVCRAEGLTFIGPPASVISSLGDKAKARELVNDLDIPMLPGSIGEPLDTTAAAALAAEVKYPVILKGVAGGGGRGMRVVADEGSFRQAWAETKTGAARLFGDSRLFLEKYLARARHVEVQILADTHGNTVHLGTRDCSLQRRNQKIVEEAPAPHLPPEVAERICAAAVAIMSAVGYVGAGTVEFLLDDELNFYFMEVNCRVQVEHPVTEMVTGMDIVAEQIRVADGDQLGYGQDDIALTGAAIECRVNAEDPANDFAPCPGELTSCTLPAGPAVRVDTHIFPGYKAPPYYDPLLAKVVAWAPDRARAIARMRAALDEIHIGGRGLRTNVEFIDQLLADSRFAACTHNTTLAESIVKQSDLSRRKEKV